MEIEDVLHRWGGVATRKQLIDATTRAEVDRALARGRVVALARGRYALPAVDEALRAAHALSGVLSHESAALRHGWPVLLFPEQPHVTVPVKRKVRQARRVGVHLHRVDLHPDELNGAVTSQTRTMVDCLRSLSFPAALAVADSALREGRSPQWLTATAAEARGHGAKQARRVAREASADAANPFESGLRAIALDVPALRMKPQVPLYAGSEFLGRPDLVDEDLMIIAEADSFEWHGGRAALARDARRYNEFVVHGWMVLRFSWEDVMFSQELVAETFAKAVERRGQSLQSSLRRRRTEVAPVRLRTS